MENKLDFCTFADLIDEYIDKVGITKCCGDILTILGNRLTDKARLIERVMKDSESDSIPQDASQKTSTTFGAEAGGEPVTSRQLGGLTLVLEREYRK